MRASIGTAVAVLVILGGGAGPARAEPVCATTPWATTCADPTGSCLVTNYPDHGPAVCLRNPLG